MNEILVVIAALEDLSNGGRKDKALICGELESCLPAGI